MFKKLTVLFVISLAALLTGCGDPVDVPVGYTAAIVNGTSGEVGGWREGPYKIKINQGCWNNCDYMAIVNLKPKSVVIDGDYWIPASKSNFNLDIAVNYHADKSDKALNRMIRMDTYTNLGGKPYMHLYQGDKAFLTNVQSKVKDRVKTAINKIASNGNRLTIDQMMEDINWTKNVRIRPAIATLVNDTGIFKLIDVSIPVSEYPPELKAAKNAILKVAENKEADLQKAGAALEVAAANRELTILDSLLSVESDQIVSPSMSKKMATMLYLVALNNCALNTNGCNMVAFPPDMTELPLEGIKVSDEQIQVLMKRIANRKE